MVRLPFWVLALTSLLAAGRSVVLEELALAVALAMVRAFALAMVQSLACVVMRFVSALWQGWQINASMGNVFIWFVLEPRARFARCRRHGQAYGLLGLCSRCESDWWHIFLVAKVGRRR